MKELLAQKIGVKAREDYRWLQLFIDYKLDFFCKGEITIKLALKAAKVDEKEFLSAVEKIKNQTEVGYGVNVENWPLDLLADYIQKTHHRYTEVTLMKLREMRDNVLQEVKEKSNEFMSFSVAFDTLANNLGAHMKKEELMLFPSIRKLANAKAGEAPKIQSVQKFIDNMSHEHDEQFEALKIIRVALNNYKAQNIERDLTNISLLMNELDLDLAHHLHLENNILFPKAIKMVNNLN